MILEIGTERYILGSVPGFDSKKKLQQNSDNADSSSDEHPDVPNNQIAKDQYAEKTNSTIRASEGIMHDNYGLTYQGNKPGYFDYGPWDSYIRKAYPYAIGKGDKPAPWGQGTQARYPDQKSIGFDKNKHGSDVLDIIKQKDGNESGAIKQSIDIAKALIKNGFGTSNQVIGAPLQQMADQEFTKFFGNQLHNDILGMLQSMQQVKNQVAGDSPDSWYDSVVDNSAAYGTALFQNVQ